MIADCDKDRQLFGDDFMHINQEGHDLVYSKIRAMLTDWPEPAAPSTRAHPDMGVRCHLGEELAPIVRQSHGFHQIDMARPEQGAPKIGWEATEPGSNLTLCTGLPQEQMRRVIALKKTKQFKLAREGKAELGAYMMAIGIQVRGYARDIEGVGGGQGGLLGGGGCRTSPNALPTVYRAPPHPLRLLSPRLALTSTALRHGRHADGTI